MQLSTTARPYAACYRRFFFGSQKGCVGTLDCKTVHGLLLQCGPVNAEQAQVVKRVGLKRLSSVGAAPGLEKKTS